MTRTKWTSNTDCTLYSRDIIERIEELEAEREDYTTQNAEHGVTPEMIDALHESWALFFPGNAAELAALSKLAKGAECAADWHHGETLIRDDYFTEYARELLEDCGTIPRDLPDWVVIDWDATARNVRVDYFPVNFDGVTYWIR